MKNRFAKKVDRSQAAVVEGLRAHGFQVQLLSSHGQDVPDLLVAKHGKWMLLEVKEENGCLTRGQLEFLVNARGPVDVVTSWIEATNTQGININQLANLHGWLVRNPEQQSLRLKKFRSIING